MYLNVYINIAYMHTHTCMHAYIHIYIYIHVCNICIYVPTYTHNNVSAEQKANWLSSYYYIPITYQLIEPKDNICYSFESILLLSIN